MISSKLFRRLLQNLKKSWAKIAAVRFIGAFLLLSSGAPLVAREGVERLVKKMNGMGAFRASINITSGTAFQSGSLLFAPGRVRLELSDGRLIVARGKELQILDTASRVLGVQELEEPKIVGLAWLLKGYLIKEDGRKARLIRDDKNAFYREVMLEWDDDFRLKKISLWPPRSDNWTTIVIQSYVPAGNIAQKEFEIKAEPGIRVINNPLNSE